MFVFLALSDFLFVISLCLHMWSDNDSPLTVGCNDSLENKDRSEHSNSGLSLFSASPLCVGEGGWRAGECVRWTAIHPELREGFQISPWHSSGLKEAPGQKWPKTGTDRLGVARDSHSGEALLGPCAVLSSVLTSLPGLEKEAGGSLTTRRPPYYTVRPDVTRPQERFTGLHSVSYSCSHWQSVAHFLFSTLSKHPSTAVVR